MAIFRPLINFANTLIVFKLIKGGFVYKCLFLNTFLYCNQFEMAENEKKKQKQNSIIVFSCIEMKPKENFYIDFPILFKIWHTNYVTYLITSLSSSRLTSIFSLSLFFFFPLNLILKQIYFLEFILLLFLFAFIWNSTDRTRIVIFSQENYFRKLWKENREGRTFMQYYLLRKRQPNCISQIMGFLIDFPAFKCIYTYIHCAKIYIEVYISSDTQAHIDR